MAESIKSRLRSASRSDPETSEDEFLTTHCDRLEKPDHRWNLASRKTSVLGDVDDASSPVLVGDDEGRSGDSVTDLDATVVAPGTAHTEYESTVNSSDNDTAPIRKKLLAGDSLVSRDEADSPICQAVKERFVMDNHGVYVTFDVPCSHRLFGTYVSVERSCIPAGATVEFIPGAVGPRLAVLQTGEVVAREEPVKPVVRDPLVSPRSAKLRKLEAELEKVKANLNHRSTPVTDGSGDASQPESTHRVGFHRSTGERYSAQEAHDGSRLERRRLVADTERSQSEYETCFETDGGHQQHGSPDSRGSRRRWRPRRGASDSENSVTGATALVEMMRTCVKETISSIVEELPRKTVLEDGPATKQLESGTHRVDNQPSGTHGAASVEAATHKFGAGGTPQTGRMPPKAVSETLSVSSESTDMGLTGVRSPIPPSIPVQRSNLPLTSISKYNNLNRTDMFYQVFLGAIKSIQQLQDLMEEDHCIRCDLIIEDLLALTRRYMDRNLKEAVLGRKAAVNVCKPVTQRKDQLTHEDDGIREDVATEQARAEEERQERKLAKKKSVEEQLKYLDTELDWVKKVVKNAKLHYTNKPFNAKKDGGKWKKGKKDGANGGTSTHDSDCKTGVNTMQAGASDLVEAAPAEFEE